MYSGYGGYCRLVNQRVTLMYHAYVAYNDDKIVKKMLNNKIILVFINKYLL